MIDQFVCDSLNQLSIMFLDVLHYRLWLAGHHHKASTGLTPVTLAGCSAVVLIKSRYHKAGCDSKCWVWLETNEVAFSCRKPPHPQQTWTLHWSEGTSRRSGKSAVLMYPLEHRAAASFVRHFQCSSSSQTLNIIQGHLLSRSSDMLMMLCWSSVWTVEAWRSLWKGADLLLQLDLNVKAAPWEETLLMSECTATDCTDSTVFGAQTDWFRVSLLNVSCCYSEK